MQRLEKGIFLLVLITMVTTSAAATELSALRIAMVPKKNIDQQIAELSPLLQLLSDHLGCPVTIVRASSYQAVAEGLLADTIDIALMGPASYAFAKQRDPQIEAFASFKRRQGTFTPEGSYYQSVLVIRSDGQKNSIALLRGGKVAFTDPHSTSGAVIPKHEFTALIGQPVESFFGGFNYTGSHDRSIQALINFQVDAAFVSSSRLDEAVRKKLIRAAQVSLCGAPNRSITIPLCSAPACRPASRNRSERSYLPPMTLCSPCSTPKTP